MKKLIVSLLFAAVLPGLATAQTASKLEEAFGQKELSNIRSGNEAEAAFLEFKADRCYDVQDLSGKKDLSRYPDVTALNNLKKNDEVVAITAEGFSAGNFNPLLYDFGTDAKMSYYRIGESGKLLKIYSDQRCRSLFNETK